MKTYLPLIALSALLIGTTTSCKKKGCLDQDAVNYNSEAKKMTVLASTHPPLPLMETIQKISM